MKLAEALALRSDAQKRLDALRSRATVAARYQEGETPTEDAAALLGEAREVVGELERLVRRINRTNAFVEVEPGLTITDAIARRDALAAERKLVTSVADAASSGDGFGWGRRMRSELRMLTDVNVSALRAEADGLARDYRELDTMLQSANWTTELAD